MTAPLAPAYNAAWHGRMSEKQLQAAVEQMCRLLQLRHYHSWTSIHSGRGFPDLVIAGPSGVLWRELKRQKEHPTPPQQAWLDTLHAAGQDAGIWRPSDLTDGRVLNELRALKGLS